ncbi:unnamed protein product [Echinostoma caproni]|uniref:Thyroid receptor-interacting protein 12 n=1 Tax=Echinostoma caproni TaxID=27848 RepID=A0A183AMN2_9TREM|nr:unnamed protein product [Echinostoma caproni]
MSSLSGSKRPATDSQPNTAELPRKGSRDISPLSCDSSETYPGQSDKRAKLTNRPTQSSSKAPSKDENSSSKSVKKSDSSFLPATKPSKSSKRDRDGTNAAPMSSLSQLTGATSVQSPKFRSAVATEVSKTKTEKISSKSKVDVSKRSKPAGSSAEKRPTKSKIRTVEPTSSPPKRIRPPVVFSEQNVELSSLSSSSSRVSSPSPIASSCSSSPTPPMSSIPPTAVTKVTVTSTASTFPETNRPSSVTVKTTPVTTTATVMSDSSNTKKEVPISKSSKVENKTAAKSDKIEKKKSAKTEVVTSTGSSSNPKVLTKRVPSESIPNRQLTESAGQKKSSAKTNQERIPRITNTNTGTTSTSVVTTVPLTTTAKISNSQSSGGSADSGAVGGDAGNAKIVSSTVPTNSGTAEPGKLSNQELELLFDRLLCLQQPHLAIRMGEILLAYQKHSTQSTVDPKAPPDGSEPEQKTPSARCAVKVLHEQPRLIAFNLRRLPLECLKQLAELIAEDEAISLKSNPQSKEMAEERSSASSRDTIPVSSDRVSRAKSDGGNKTLNSGDGSRNSR